MDNRSIIIVMNCYFMFIYFLIFIRLYYNFCIQQTMGGTFLQIIKRIMIFCLMIHKWCLAPPNPQIFDDLHQLPIEYKLTTHGKQFVLYDSIDDYGLSNQRIIIFVHLIVWIWFWNPITGFPMVLNQLHLFLIKSILRIKTW